MEIDKESQARLDLDQAALFFHKHPVPGKLEIQATKPLGNQRDLALAYSPGVAAPCLAIRDDPALAAEYTSRANLVAVISNGTAVLGLGDIGPLASKPVMEGKAVLFKKFAGIDVFDIEIDAPGVERIVSTVAALEPTFGGINLEDIKAPECFIIEQALRERMKIPVMHDDQHGTAIIAAAGLLNACLITKRKLDEIKVVVNGAGASARPKGRQSSARAARLHCVRFERAHARRFTLDNSCLASSFASGLPKAIGKVSILLGAFAGVALQTSGSRTVTFVPSPGRLSILRRPPCRSIKPFTTERPSPVPS